MSTATASDPPDPAIVAEIAPLTITGLLLLDPHGHDPTVIESVTFDDRGIAVIRSRGQDPRILPWESVAAQAVETWAGGFIPGRLMDPQTDRNRSFDSPASPSSGPDASVDPADPADPVGGIALEPPGDVDPPGNGARTSRPSYYTDAGALISIQTRTGTYRFLRSGGDPAELAVRISELAVHHQGPSGASTVTTVAMVRRRRGAPSGRSTWRRIRPWLVGLLIIVIAAAVTAILMQSAGTIHLPFLGGTGSTSSSTGSILSDR